MKRIFLFSCAEIPAYPAVASQSQPSNLTGAGAKQVEAERPAFKMRLSVRLQLGDFRLRSSGRRLTFFQRERQDFENPAGGRCFEVCRLPGGHS